VSAAAPKWSFRAGGRSRMRTCCRAGREISNAAAAMTWESLAYVPVDTSGGSPVGAAIAVAVVLLAFG